MSQEASVTRPRAGALPASDADAYTAQGETPAIDASELRRAAAEWRKGPVAQAEAKIPPRMARFATWSDLDVADLLTPADVPVNYMRDLGFPGEYPFTR